LVDVAFSAFKNRMHALSDRNLMELEAVRRRSRTAPIF
jgi:hypothetical protein